MSISHGLSTVVWARMKCGQVRCSSCSRWFFGDRGAWACPECLEKEKAAEKKGEVRR